MEPSVRECSATDCRARHYAKGYCKKPYTPVSRHGRLTPETERGVIRVCAAEGCDRTDTVGLYCRRHARQVRAHGRLTPEREHRMGSVGCAVEGCRGGHRAKGLCVKHYNQSRWQIVKRAIRRLRSLEERAPTSHAPAA